MPVKRMLIVFILTFSILMLFLSKSYLSLSHAKDEEMPISTGSSYFLSQSEIYSLRMKAENGDKNSSFRLYQYYSLVELDKKLEYEWLEKSAKDGHPIAQYNLAIFLMNEGKVSDAVVWAKEASKNGVALSDELNALIKDK